MYWVRESFFWTLSIDMIESQLDYCDAFIPISIYLADETSAHTDQYRISKLRENFPRPLDLWQLRKMQNACQDPRTEYD